MALKLVFFETQAYCSAVSNGSAIDDGAVCADTLKSNSMEMRQSSHVPFFSYMDCRSYLLPGSGQKIR